ncbi:MAG TPA: pyridoxamine 5'-phosphate oxidase family protein [Vicinamibacteria bacterium]|nr:pyridoxamine 5'-phosphate oxidase family protein [Vicinamibacteria bacterium]
MADSAPDAIQKLHELVKDIKVAMMTTRRPDGRLVSRPMATQEEPAPGADFWFVTVRDSDKVTDVAFDPNVNLAFYKDRTTEWVSVSGTALLSDDRALIHRLYRDDWKAWFGNEGDPRHGTPDDPRMLLIGVRAASAHFMALDKPQPVVLFEMLKARLTGEPAEVAETRTLSGSQVRRR